MWVRFLDSTVHEKITDPCNDPRICFVAALQSKPEECYFCFYHLKNVTIWLFKTLLCRQPRVRSLSCSVWLWWMATVSQSLQIQPPLQRRSASLLLIKWNWKIYLVSLSTLLCMTRWHIDFNLWWYLSKSIPTLPQPLLGILYPVERERGISGTLSKERRFKSLYLCINAFTSQWVWLDIH